MVSTTLTQLSSFSGITGRRSNPFSPPKGTSVLVLRKNKRGCAASISNAHTKATEAVHNEDSQNGRSLNLELNDAPEPQPVIVEDKPIRAAKIHDFCLGIPFGGLVLSGGLVGFIFSRNPASLGSGVLIGGGLLGLSVLSLKVWRTGKSSLPFMLGQAVLAVVLLWKNIQTYSMKKVIFPSGCYAAISAAMLCFYAYVVISGGNPPPKKKPTVAIQS